MKNVPNRVISILAVLFSFGFDFAKNNPPPPALPPPPGSPIDSEIGILIFVSLIFGLYKIYQFNIKKASN